MSAELEAAPYLALQGFLRAVKVVLRLQAKIESGHTREAVNPKRMDAESQLDSRQLAPSCLQLQVKAPEDLVAAW